MRSVLRHIRHLVGRPGRLLRTFAYHASLQRLTGRRHAGLHLGCGSRRIEGFLHLDRSSPARSDVIAGIERIKLRAGAVGTLYASHVFEHVSRHDARAVLEEWHRVLAPGGRLYVCVPDLEALCRVYLERLSTYRDDAEAREQAELAAGIMYGGQAYRHDVHYFGYAFDTLRDLLTACGFRDVRRFERDALPFAPPRDAGLAAIGDTPVSLNVEATA